MAGWGEPGTSQLPPSGPLGSSLWLEGEGRRGWPGKTAFPLLGVRSLAPTARITRPPSPDEATASFGRLSGHESQLLALRAPGAATRLGCCWGKVLGVPFRTPYPGFLSSSRLTFLSQASLKWPPPLGLPSYRVGEVLMGCRRELARRDLLGSPLFLRVLDFSQDDLPQVF